MAERFRVAVIGAGDMGERHVHGWQQAGHDVVAVADVDLARARELAHRYAILVACADYRTVLSDPAVDIVSICAPLAAHAPITIEAAAHSKHVFCEKPLARSWAEATAMEAAVNRAGIHFGLGFQRNLAEGVGLLTRWAREGRFGHPLVFTSDLLQEVRPKRVMHDRLGNNGPIMDAGCHYYLLWQTVFQSNPRSVYAQGRILARDRPEIAHFKELAIDTGVITIEYASGDVGAMTTSWGLAAQCKMHGRPDRLFGPLGGAEGDTNAWLDLYQGEQVERIQITTQDLHQQELALFARAITDGMPPRYGLRAGKEMLAVTLAIFQSIETGAVVPVSYEF